MFKILIPLFLSMCPVGSVYYFCGWTYSSFHSLISIDTHISDQYTLFYLTLLSLHLHNWSIIDYRRWYLCTCILKHEIGICLLFLSVHPLWLEEYTTLFFVWHAPRLYSLHTHISVKNTSCSLCTNNQVQMNILHRENKRYTPLS
jgi:hypothetical protein